LGALRDALDGEVMRYWPALLIAIAMAALFMPFGIMPLPWRGWQYFGAAFFTVALLAILFIRRRRSRIA
jgi:membrane protein implicated in regulation of membrane protease activity